MKIGQKIRDANITFKPIAWYTICRDMLENRLDNPETIKRSANAFMPAALEVQETPPSPTGRAIIWSIVLLFLIAVLWGFFGKIDIVAVAQGKIIPSGRVKTIQPLEIGTVKAIHVQEGQMVSQGDPLIILDSTATQADVNRLQQQLEKTQLQQARQSIFHQLLNQPELPDNWPQQAEAGFKLHTTATNQQQIARQQQLLNEQLNEYSFRRISLYNELEKQRAEQESIQATVDKFKRTLPLITERTKSLEKLLTKHMVARSKYLELEQERIEQEQDLATLKAQHRELDAGIKASEAKLHSIKAEAQKNNLAEMNETALQIATLQQELIKAKQRNQQQAILSPIDGTVQQLAVHTIGGVVTPAQELMLIVPNESALEVEALILNKDVGFVSEGQVAEVKIDTFNFTKYGMIDGEITHLSNDAIQDENLGLVYMAKVLIDKSSMWINDKEVNLSPGMTTTVEIKIGKRRIIEYFLSPLLRYKQESIRER